MSVRLRELIRSVRACKTMAEERAVITKELAMIRTAFKEEGNPFRHRNVAKLLFMHMLGYPSHFGQMECLKLIASPRYPEKRIGYLGLSLLLTEELEVLTLVTNSIQQDLRSNNQFVAGLALTVLGNMSSIDMCRDLFPDVEKCLRNSNSYVRKKAAIACVRILNKVPELIEDCLDRIAGLLTDRNHAVMLTGCTLMQCAMHDDPALAQTFRAHVPTLVRTLKNLVLNNYAPEYDVSGVTDPFLQVKILQLLRELAIDDDAVDEMNDILAQVATNTQTNSKNAGNSILYECANTILSIDCASGLRTLAINILGPFLTSSKSNNNRYVALTMLAKVVKTDTQAVQRHRATIVSCLKDADVSIRRRALELLYCLVNSKNVRALSREMLNYLVIADKDVKAELCQRTAAVLAKFAPDAQWHIDTLTSLLEICGNFASQEVVASIVNLVGSDDENHCYGVHKLYWAVRDDQSQASLNSAALWCIGEFGQHLLTPCPQGIAAHAGESVSEEQVLELLVKMVKLHSATTVTKSYVVNAAFKLTSRFSDAAVLRKLAKIIARFNKSVHLELQTRSCEFINILKPENRASLAARTLEPMPLPDLEELRRRRARTMHMGDSDDSDDSDSDSDSEEDSDEGDGASETKSRRGPSGGAADALDILGGGGVESNASGGGSGGGGSSDLLDLSDIFSGGSGGGGSTAPPAPTPAVGNGSGSSGDDLLGMFGLDLGGSSGSAAQPAAPTPASQPQFAPIVAYQKNGLRIVFDCFRTQNPQVTRIRSTIQNTSGAPVTGVVFQAAVLKQMSITSGPVSSQTIPPNGSATQELNLTNTLLGKKSPAMKFKLSFAVGGNPVNDGGVVRNFPAGI